MTKLERTFMLMSRAAATLGVLFLLLVAAMSVADIVTREITGRPIRGAHDLASLLTIIIIASSFPAGLLERRQIKVTVLGSFLPESINRAMEVLGAVLTGAMFLFIAYFVTLHAIRVSDSHQATMVLNMPIGSVVVDCQHLFLGLHSRAAFRHNRRNSRPPRFPTSGLSHGIPQPLACSAWP
jgi:TRAP-type C4-dicarboxylate transport system permease small subunit